MLTPWGNADYKADIGDEGIVSVSTPSHGGVMVPNSVAARRLSDAARREATVWGNFTCYEEDCDWAIAANELEEVTDYFRGDSSREEFSAKHVVPTLERWCPDYLGIEHAEPVVNEGEAILRTAWGSWHKVVPNGYCGVRVELLNGEFLFGIVPQENYDEAEMRGEGLKQAKVISLERFGELGSEAF